MPSSMAAPAAATKVAMTAAAMMSPSEVAVPAMGMFVSTAEMTVSAVMVSMPAREDYAAADCGLETITVAGSAVII